MDSSPVVFRAQSIKSMLFKYLFDTLKGYIHEVKIMFREDGIKITKKDMMWLTYIYLGADKFESYYSKGTFVLGVDIKSFYKIIKGATVHDKITLEFSEDQEYLIVILENSVKGMTKKFELKTLDLQERIIKANDLTYDHSIKIPSKTFQETMKEMHALGSKKVQICSFDNTLMFSSDRDCEIRHELILKDTSTNQVDPDPDPNETGAYIDYKSTDENIIRGEYALSYLNSFIKATSMSLYMMIYLNNDKPMILEWPVGDLGVYRVTLQENDNTEMATSSK
jgi:proliferating cell nuclear antigen